MEPGTLSTTLHKKLVTGCYSDNLPKIPMNLEYRELSTLKIRGGEDEKDPSSIRATLATEQPVLMFDWERFEFIPQTLRMDAMESENQVPLLDSHSRFSVDDQLGSVRGIGTEKDTAEGELFFASDEKSQRTETKIREGHLTDLSVGYRVLKQHHIPAGEKATVKGRTYEGGEKGLNVVTSWRLQETSVTPIGADDAAKIRGFESIEQARSQFQAGQNPPKDLPSKPTKEPKQKRTAMPEPKTQEPDVSDILAKEEKRKEEITAFASRWKVPADDVKPFLKDHNRSVQQFKEFVLERGPAAPQEPVPSDPMELGLNKKEKKSYSIRKIILARGTGEKLEGIEKEAHDALEEDYHRVTGDHAQGVLIPSDMMGHQNTRGDLQKFENGMRAAGVEQAQIDVYLRNLEATVLADGGYLVETEERSIIAYCREKLILGELGATTLTGLRGNISWPRQLDELTATWVAEEGPCTPSYLTFGELNASPKRIVSATGYTLQLLRQSSTGVEAMVRREIGYAIAKGIDRGGLYGAGGLAPLGLTNTPGLQPFTFGGAPTLAKLREVIALLECCHCASGMFRWLMNPTVKAAWASTERLPNSGVTLAMTSGGNASAEGYPISHLCSHDNTVIAGDWPQLFVGQWGGMDLVIDPYTEACSGSINVTANHFADAGVFNACAFAQSTDDGNQ